MRILTTVLVFSLSINAQEINPVDLQEVTSAIHIATQSPSETCNHCAGELDQETVKKSLLLDDNELTTSTNYVGGDDYIIALKRTTSSPKKIALKVEYGERVCARTVAHQNPLSGQLGFSCLFYQTEKRSKTINLDFSSASALEGDETQSLRLVISKDPDARKLNHQLKITNGLFDRIEHKDGLFRDKYVISKLVGSRAPAVIPDFE